jgi:hypothetical protein
MSWSLMESIIGNSAATRLTVCVGCGLGGVI